MVTRKMIGLLLLHISNGFAQAEQNNGLAIAPAMNQLSSKVTEGKYFEAIDTLNNICSNAKNDQTISQQIEVLSKRISCLNTISGALLAQTSDYSKRTGIKEFMQPLVDETNEAKVKKESERDFMGLTWGVGFGFSFANDDRIEDAEIVNGVLRVKASRKEQPRIVLEFHRYFWCNAKGKLGDRGCGPFIAVATSQDKVLSGIGTGIMYGRKASDTANDDGFSIGLGAVLDEKTKNLAKGYKVDEPVPTGATEVRYEEKARWSLLVFVTRTF